MQTLIRNSLAGALAVGMALVALSVVQAQPSAPPGSVQASTPYAYCWTTRRPDGWPHGEMVYYFSRVWSMGREGPTLGFQPQFQSFVSARYTSVSSSSAQCVRFFGRQEAEQNMNNLAADARRNGREVVFTDWWPR